MFYLYCIPGLDSNCLFGFTKMCHFIVLIFAGRSAHVMTFEVGAVLEDAKWQAPVYCFEKKDAEKNPKTHPVTADGYLETSVQERTLRGLLGS